MDIYVVTETRVSPPSQARSYHASEREAHIAATERVNRLRADLDPETLPPVDVSSWKLGLIGAQQRTRAARGINICDVSALHFDDAGFDVQIERAELQAMSILAIDEREHATILAALRDYQRRNCSPDLDEIASNLNRHEPLTADEIDTLCMRINGHKALPPDANIVIELDGGLIQGVAADRPITVRVVDYDVEGADPAGLAMVARYAGNPVPASVSAWAVEAICIDPEWIDRLDEASEAA